jgi:hypothetical protein
MDPAIVTILRSSPHIAILIEDEDLIAVMISQITHARSRRRNEAPLAPIQAVTWETSVSIHVEERVIEKPYHDRTKPSLRKVRMGLPTKLTAQD